MFRFVGDPDFEDGIEISRLLERLLKTVPKLCSTDAQLLMLEQYETLFGIFDHNKPGVSASNPFAVVELHAAEDVYTYSLKRERMEQFMFHGVKDAFGVSWLEYLQLPAADAQEMMIMAAQRKAKEDNNSSDLLRQLAQTGK